MAEFKLVISDPKTGRSMQKVAPEAIASQLIGKKIGDTIKGELFDMTGVELLITGGSDNAGFPMRKDVRGGGRKKILIVAGVGARKKAAGLRQRKTVSGNTISSRTVQINLKVVSGEGRMEIPLAEGKKDPKMNKEERRKAHADKEKAAQKEAAAAEKKAKEEEASKAASEEKKG